MSCRQRSLGSDVPVRATDDEERSQTRDVAHESRSDRVRARIRREHGVA